MRSGSLKRTDISTKEISVKLKNPTEKQDLSSQKGRENTGSPNTLERRSKRCSYATTR